MRRRILVLSVLFLALPSHPAHAAGLTAWSLHAGSGPAGVGHQSRTGTGSVAGVSAQVRRWFALGADAGFYRFGAPRDIVSIPEASFRFDGTRMATVALVTRFESPLRTALVPFVQAETGWAWERWGDVHVRNDFFGPPLTVLPGYRHDGLYSAVGAGLGWRAARPWPRLEASVRYAALAGPNATEITSSRLAIGY
jgi:hypothetical protein